MRKNKTVSNVAVVGAAVAICLSAVQVVQAEGNPLDMQNFAEGRNCGPEIGTWHER